MKTMTMMKTMMIGMMMCFAMSAMASTSQYIQCGRGSHPTVSAQCNCKQCQKARKQLDKHMRKHLGKQNRMTCRECMKYSQMLNAHNNQHGNCCNCNGHNCNTHNNNGHNGNSNYGNGHFSSSRRSDRK